MAPPDTIPLDSLGKPFYAGSVQNLYAIPGCDTHMVTETTSRGSVFDVGSIFAIEGSDLSRAVFRHAFYSRMHEPEFWQDIRRSIESTRHLSPSYREELIGGALETLCRDGAHTHHEGMIDAKFGRVVRRGVPEHPSRFNVVRRYQILKPAPLEALGHPLFDYDVHRRTDQFVIPLEWIVRFGITPSSSIYRKYREMAPEDQRAFEDELGTGSALIPWVPFDRPVNDCTTKFEPEDRNLRLQEASELSGLPGHRFGRALQLAVLGAWSVRQLLGRIDLRLWDIKWEFAADDDAIVFVDTIDTDSFRATRFLDSPRGRVVIHFNKQAIRDYFALLHPDWMEGVNRAKAQARREGRAFPNVLGEAQARGEAPATPEVEPAFRAIQSAKLDLIRRFMLEELPPAEITTRLDELAAEEFAFYQARNLATAFLERNGVAGAA